MKLRLDVFKVLFNVYVKIIYKVFNLCYNFYLSH